jgi:CCR4-NOT transcriptional complex subunit CAF120
VLGAVTQPSTADSPAQTHSNVITLNTAGANLYLFSCPSTVDLISWAAALRLATWEKSRLEEMYTAHLIRITLNDGRTTPSPLIHGRMEGWVRVRIAGQVDWKRFWMVVTVPSQPPTPSDELGPVDSRDGKLSAPIPVRKNRMSTLFSRERSPERTTRPVITLYASQKPKDKKTPQLSFVSVTQAFSVYPERPKLISTSTLIKLEGTYGQEEIAGPMKMRDAWLLFMPELEGARNPGGEMLKWLIGTMQTTRILPLLTCFFTGIHDAFELYGRPKAYSWDPRDSVSMMFAYPIGQHKDVCLLLPAWNTY